MFINNLNEKQKEAVEKVSGPLLILAGAGSGKTRVLTTRVAYLVKQKNVDPSNILAITFTNKAAKEMKERIIKQIGSDAYNIQISTFHSFGLKLIKENYNLIGYSKKFVILDSDDSLSVIKKILKGMNLDPKIYNPKNIKYRISSSKNEFVNPHDFQKYIGNDFDKVIHKVYMKYEETLKKNNSLDFDDLLVLPIVLFKENPSILAMYQEKYKYILIDEYQDTNEAQYILSKLISAKYKNICVVGDADQSVYGWRGANYKNILNFEKDYPNAHVVMLEENYRSTKNILDSANNVIKNNNNRKDKKLWTTNIEGVKIKYNRCYDERHEGSYIISQIKEINKEIPYSEIAVLYRTNAQSRIIEEEFLKANIPYKVVGSFYFYNRKEIKDLISYLRLIYNEKDDVSLIRCINTPKRGIGNKTIETLMKKADIENISMFESIQSGKELLFKELILELRRESENLSLTELVDLILLKTGIKAELEAEKTLDADIRLENLEEFKSITKAFEEEQGIVSLSEFLEELTLVADVSEHDDEKEKVTLMTMHSAKGLEFDCVFVVGMEEGIFPHANSSFEAQELEEERRLCYVAITRAKKLLYFVNARRRTIFGKDQINPPSRFINEVGEDLIDNINAEAKPKEINKKEMFKENADYSVGDKINHTEFGEGIVISIDKSIATIAFSHKIGIKKLMKNHKSISKVG